MVRVFMLHAMNEEVLKTLDSKEILEEDILTFDDSLYSVYKYREELKKIKNKKIIFVSGNMVRLNTTQPNNNVVKCNEAHQKYFDNPIESNLDNYCSIKELKELKENYNFIIGLHGFYHLHIVFNFEKLNKLSTFYIKLFNKRYKGLKNIKQLINKDVSLLNKFYEELLKENIISKNGKIFFAWPYNLPSNYYKYKILHKINIEQFYGKERIEIDFKGNIKWKNGKKL